MNIVIYMREHTRELGKKKEALVAAVLRNKAREVTARNHVETVFSVRLSFCFQLLQWFVSAHLSLHVEFDLLVLICCAYLE
jgi:hypothetical protein